MYATYGLGGFNWPKQSPVCSVDFLPGHADIYLISAALLGDKNFMTNRISGFPQNFKEQGLLAWKSILGETGSGIIKKYQNLGSLKKPR